MREPLFCPFCGTSAVHAATTVFVEYGPYDYDRGEYLEEGDVAVYRCDRAGCGDPFADLRGFDLTAPPDDAPDPLPPQP